MDRSSFPCGFGKQDNALHASEGKKVKRVGTRVDVTYGMRDARGPGCPGLSRLGKVDELSPNQTYQGFSSPLPVGGSQGTD
jgi:hypothetical protein